MDGLTPNELVDLARELASRHSLADAELYVKRGRSRLFALESRPWGDEVAQVESQVRDRYESGWALRYGGKRGWGFTSGTGDPPTDPPLARPRGGRLLLPQTPGPEHSPIELPQLLSETKALRGLAALSSALPPVAVNRRLEVQDGEAISRLANNHGLAVEWPHRTGLVSLEERLAGGAILRLYSVDVDAAAALEVAIREWVGIVTQAQRVRWSAPPNQVSDPGVDAEADELEQVPSARRREARRASVLFSSAAASSLVGSALASWRREARGSDVASPVVQLCDAPDWPAGPMTAHVDGQGDLLARRSIVHGGTLVANLEDPETAIVRRGWRDLPARGYQQPVLLPGAAGEEELISGIEDGWWVLARVEVPAAANVPRPPIYLGRRIRERSIDRDTAPTLLEIRVRPGDFCRSIRELGNRISFHPIRDAILGLPAVRVEGVKVREC